MDGLTESSVAYTLVVRVLSFFDPRVDTEQRYENFFESDAERRAWPKAVDYLYSARWVHRETHAVECWNHGTDVVIWRPARSVRK